MEGIAPAPQPTREAPPGQAQMNEGQAPSWQASIREQLDSVLRHIDTAWEREKADVREASAQSARERLFETLNQQLRRLRQTQTPGELAALAVEVAAPFAGQFAVFVFRDGKAEAEAAKNMGELPLSFDPNEGAAFRAAIESHDPVIAIGTPSEISPLLSERIHFETSERIHLFPLVVRGAVHGVAFAAGDVQPAPLELMSGLVALRMEAITATPPPKRDDLVSIDTPSKLPVQQKVNWSDLSSADQALHLRAQRFARMRVAEIRLEHTEAFQRGFQSRDFYGSLREPIDKAREEFRKDYLNRAPTMVDYLYLELIRSLTGDNERMLGPGFPGPLVNG
jgi:hypothetical protein